MQNLPDPPPAFIAKKAKILEQLSLPDAEYTDLSPKGSVDEGIRTLIDDVNAHAGLVTTSSCAGRVSVFLEGIKSLPSSDGHDDLGGMRLAGAVGGKGLGGTWLHVSHDPIAVPGEGFGDGERKDWARYFDLVDEGASGGSVAGSGGERRLIHFKFEPMILHVLTASFEHAQLVIRCALQAGFRESGAVNLTGSASEQPTPMVGIRSMGLGFESLIGVAVDDKRQCTVSASYLQTLVDLANERFSENRKRIERFQAGMQAASQQRPQKNREGLEWEDAAARRERKRAEGLERSAQLKEQQCSQPPDED